MALEATVCEAVRVGPVRAMHASSVIRSMYMTMDVEMIQTGSWLYLPDLDAKHKPKPDGSSSGGGTSIDRVSSLIGIWERVTEHACLVPWWHHISRRVTLMVF